jgi:glycosyltransferase involved in cell wall biosynthesis
MSHAVVLRLSKLLYRKAYFDFKGSLQRRVRAWNSRRLANAAGARSVLHITTLDMPGRIKPGVKHFLLIDSTWNSWSKFISRDGYSKNLWRDIETLDPQSFKQASHIFSLGEYVCDDLVEHYGVPREKCTSIGSGQGAVSPYFGPKDYSSRTILFVAKTRFESKGGPLLLDAFKIAVAQDPSIQLIMVGSDKATLHATGIPNVTTKSFIPQVELQKLFNQASLFVLPAINEPWGMVYLEAMACRTPVVGLRRNSLPEMTLDGQFGFLIDRPDAQLLATAITAALSDPNKLDVVGRAAQKHVLDTYTWERAVDRMLAVIDQV